MKTTVKETTKLMREVSMQSLNDLPHGEASKFMEQLATDLSKAKVDRFADLYSKVAL